MGEQMRLRRSARVLGSILIPVLILLGCASDSRTGIYRAYYAVTPPENQLATLYLGTASEAIVDDRYFISGQKYGVVKLVAGTHRIKWVASFGVSVLVEPAGHAAFGMTSIINFEAGHSYKLLQDRTTGHGYRAYLWVEDMTTGNVVFGEKKP